jgi:hypothetical protein
LKEAFTNTMPLMKSRNKKCIIDFAY